MRSFKLNRRGSIALFVFIAIVGATLFFVLNSKDSKDVVVETKSVEVGSIVNTITAVGRLEATNTVIVGTQVSGVVEKIYVDFNSPVKKGDLLAQLDKTTLLSSLEGSQAERDKAMAEFVYQSSNFNRKKAVFEKGLLSESEYDLALYNFKKSEASKKTAEANLKKALKNLSYAQIYSPIDGVVMNKAVEEGQTVAASMNTPELFTITNDLDEMQVEADIDEADIGLVEKGQRVEFTVDAFPQRMFEGTISEVRLQPKTSSNVVTYKVIISLENPELLLKPGMTANIVVYINELYDILVVNTAALNFSPDKQTIQLLREFFPEDEESDNKKTSEAKKRDKKTKDNKSKESVWILEKNLLKKQTIQTGLTDGINSQIVSGLKQGDVVVSNFFYGGKTEAKSTSDGKSSPFVQKRGGNQQNKGK